MFLKIYDVPPERLAEPKTYLCKMVTNCCRDLQKAARKKVGAIFRRLAF
ncbi:hypothetical protein [Paenibacillus sp. Soil787]|nr:hypothetical protein [Paenibacillus sp. Soil787]